MPREGQPSPELGPRDLEHILLITEAYPEAVKGVDLARKTNRATSGVSRDLQPLKDSDIIVPVGGGFTISPEGAPALISDLEDRIHRLSQALETLRLIAEPDIQSADGQ